MIFNNIFRKIIEKKYNVVIKPRDFYLTQDKSMINDFEKNKDLYTLH